MMQHFNSGRKKEKEKRKSNKEAVTGMPSILHHKMAICHSWACAAHIIRESVCGTVMEICCMYRPALSVKTQGVSRLHI